MIQQKTQLEKIYKNKSFDEKIYTAIRIALIAALYMSLLDEKSFNKRIKRIINKYGDDKAIMKMVSVIIAVYKQLNKRKFNNSVEIAEAINKKHLNENMHTVSFKEQRKQVGLEKQAFIMSDIQANRLNNKWFYLCSSHSDSAKDHKDYQGKVYIDENCDDYDCLMLANQYKMRSYQWVIGKPVWMVTRPNCRHYFRALSYEEVKGHSYKELIDKYNMHRKVGDRTVMQTLKGGEDIDIVIKAYHERLETHLAMNRVRPNDFIQRAIDKDRILLKKWHLKKKNASV